jgi:hypothetical protein
MDGVMDLLFGLVVVFAMIIQGVAANKKKQRQQAERRRAGEGSGLPTVDSAPTSPSQDGRGQGDIFTELARAGAARDGGGASSREPDSSEDLIPKEIWQEIADLASGRGPSVPAPAPPTASEPQPTRERLEREEVTPLRQERPRTREVGLRTRPTPPVAERTSVPERSRRLAARLEEEPVPVPAETARAVPATTPAPEMQLEVTGEEGPGRMEWLFGGRDPETLRKAILLREVLGPPLALREEEEI